MSVSINLPESGNNCSRLAALNSTQHFFFSSRDSVDQVIKGERVMTAWNFIQNLPVFIYWFLKTNKMFTWKCWSLSTWRDHILYPIDSHRRWHRLFLEELIFYSLTHYMLSHMQIFALKVTSYSCRNIISLYEGKHLIANKRACMIDLYFNNYIKFSSLIAYNKSTVW